MSCGISMTETADAGPRRARWVCLSSLLGKDERYSTRKSYCERVVSEQGVAWAAYSRISGYRASSADGSD